MPLKVFVILLLSVFSLSLGLHAQTHLDSLRHEVKISARSGNIGQLGNLYAQMGYRFVSNGDYDSAIHYYRLSQETNPSDQHLVASNLNGLAVSFSALTQMDSMLHYYRQALKIYESLRDTVHTAVIASNLAIAYKNIGLYDLSIRYAFDALRQQELLDASQAVASTYSTISQVYVHTEDYGSALNYARKALFVRQRIGYTRGVAMSYNNIGEIFLHQNSYDSAVSNLEKSLRLKRENNERKSLASTLGNLGTAYLKMGKPAEAESYFKDALSVKVEFKDQLGEAVCYDNLARVALARNELNDAKEFLSKSEAILQKYSLPEPLKDHLEIWMTYFEAKNDPLNALAFQRKLLQVNDTLFSIEKAKSINALRIRYETDQKEREIQRLEAQDRMRTAELRASQYLVYGLTGAAFLLIVIAVLIFKSYRNARKERLMQELFNRELNHRVKNNLQLLSSFLSLQSEELTDESAVVAVKSNQSRVNAMALIHKKLYLSDDTRSIRVSDYLKEIIDFLLYSYDYSTQSIVLNYQMPSLTLDVDKAIPIGLIVNELVANSLKHAFPGVEKPELRVMGELVSDKELLISISDNGKALFDVNAVGSEQSFGLKMVKLLLKDLRGKMQVVSQERTVIEIKLPFR